MQKHCLNCGHQFIARRNTKKYCNDSCKLSNFYTRNGISLPGTALNNTTLQLAHSAKQDRKELAFNLNENANAKNEGLTVNDKTLDLLTERILLVLETRIQAAIDKAIAKLTDTNIKSPLALNVQPENETLTLNATNKTDENIGENIKVESLYQIQLLELPHEEPEPENETAQENAIQQTQPEGETQDKSQQSQDYKWVYSTFTTALDRYQIDENIFTKFTSPEEYWETDDQLKVKWVTLRFRCLAGTLFRLSNHAFVDSEALFGVADAFNQLAAHPYFKALPANYPFTGLITELRDKMQYIALENRDNERIPFRLSRERRIELIAIRYLTNDFVPKIKFSQLNF